MHSKNTTSASSTAQASHPSEVVDGVKRKCVTRVIRRTVTRITRRTRGHYVYDAETQFQAIHPSKVVDEVKRKCVTRIIRRTRDRCVDDAKVSVAIKYPPRRNASSLNSDCIIGTTRNNEEKMVMTGLFLAYEIIFEILSWLPVKSLLRFKCVCKEWCSIIEDPKFIQRHAGQAPHIIGYTALKHTGFVRRRSHCGLILEECVSTKSYRLRNLATRQVLDLPGLGAQKGVCADICLIPSSNELKVVYIDYFEEESHRLTLIYNILRVGNDGLTWKRLDSPYLCELRETPPVTLVIGTVLYSTKRRLMGDQSIIDCLDLENDEIKTGITLAHNLFPESRVLGLMHWNGNPSFVYYEEERLNVWVFENFHKPRKVLIPMTFLKDFPGMSRKNMLPVRVVGNQMFWYFGNEDWIAVFSFDSETQTELKLHTCASTKMMVFSVYQPTLCHFKGMRPCTIAGDGDVEPCDNAKETFIKLTSQHPTA